MKETQQNRKDIDAVEIRAEVQKQKQHLLRIVPHRGHKVFEINPETLEAREVELVKSHLERVKVSKLYLGLADEYTTVQRFSYDVRPGFDYVSALNKKNAIRIHLRKIK